MKRRSYLNFDPVAGYPAGPDIFYECSKCGGVIPSEPKDGIGCSCRNIFIDVDAGRVSIRDDSMMKIFKESI